MPRLELSAGAEDAGARLDVYLAASPEIGTRAAAQRLIEAGRVQVGGRARLKRHRLTPGERVVVELHAPAEGGTGEAAGAAGAAGASVLHTVVFEDDHLIVVDKPAGVVVHPGHGQAHGTLAQALAGRAAGGPPDRPGIVHRLDRDTSGLLVVARSEAVHAALSEALRRRELRREYVALVEDIPDARSGTIDAPVGRDRADRTLISTTSDRPRSARTHFEIREALARTALLALRLETGRTHQIRAHLAAIEHPVCGDARYGGRSSGARLGLERQFLHSSRLGFVHPLTGEELDFESALPGDLEAALERARAESPPGARRED
ncbi:MAG: RluA family pseudouridine synthase [Thermoleophilaceae bacterium]|nr:RluA family pseudouridine synthase [Thermoleophilaceae bacterium]